MPGVLSSDGSTFSAPSSACGGGVSRRVFLLVFLRGAGAFVSWRIPLFGTRFHVAGADGRIHDAADVDRFDSFHFARPGRATFLTTHRKSALSQSALVLVFLNLDTRNILAYGSNCRRRTVAVAKRVIKESLACSCVMR
jgi:hypothetical protein